MQPRPQQYRSWRKLTDSGVRLAQRIAEDCLARGGVSPLRLEGLGHVRVREGGVDEERRSPVAPADIVGSDSFKNHDDSNNDDGEGFQQRL